MIIAPIAFITGYALSGTPALGATIPATLPSGNTLNIYVTPWYNAGANGSCTVAADGVTVTAISPANVAPGLAGNFVQIGSIIYQVQTWNSASSITLIPNSAAPAGSGQVYYQLECRYGMTQGDVVQVDNEQFTLSAYSQTCVVVSGKSVSTWTLTRNIAGSAAASHTTGSGKLLVDVISGAGNIDQYAGSLLPGKTQSVSPILPIGLPVAYIAYLVSVSTLGTLNTWPVVGVTPTHNIGPIETQTTGNLAASRLATQQLAPSLTISGGQLTSTLNLPNVLYNGGFEIGALGTVPVGWLWGGTPGQCVIENGVVYAGRQAVEITGNGLFQSQPQPSKPGDKWACWRSSLRSRLLSDR